MAKEKAERKTGPQEREETLKRAAAFRERAAEQQERQAVRMGTYTVKAGDSLSKIAKALYGDAGRWPEIFEANKDQISDPDVIRVGQELRIPPK
jgi:nucleoid-associated protein YgaU